MTLRMHAPRPAAVARMREVAASRWFRPVVRVTLGAVVLAAVVAHVGAAPFIAGLAALDAPALGAAVALTALATAAAAWRWSVVSRALGVPLPWRSAVGMYYRSQFLNSVLPGGVVGDVRRAADHGRSVDRRGPAARAVVIERGIGQVVQLLLAVPILVIGGMGPGGMGLGGLLPSVALVVAGAVAVVLVPAVVSARARRLLRREAIELRTAVGSTPVLVQAVAASVVVCLCHVATFAVAVAAVGAQVPQLRVLALGFAVLLAASVPVGVGGWGPREGVAGWAFATAGLGASTGIAAATLFGVLALLSVAPGAVLPATRFAAPAAPAAAAATPAAAPASTVAHALARAPAPAPAPAPAERRPLP